MGSGLDQEPAFHTGDEVMIVSPVGWPPPEGPVFVLGCSYFDPRTGIEAYIIQYDTGRQEIVDGVELVNLDSWAKWMEKYAC